MAEPRLGCGQAQGTAIGQRIRRRNMAYACVVDARRLDGASPLDIVRRARKENLIVEREPFQNTRGLTERGAQRSRVLVAPVDKRQAESLRS